MGKGVAVLLRQNMVLSEKQFCYSNDAIRTQFPRAEKVDKCVEHFQIEKQEKERRASRLREVRGLDDGRGRQMSAHVKEASLVTARVCAKRRERNRIGGEKEMMWKTKMRVEEETRQTDGA